MLHRPENNALVQEEVPEKEKNPSLNSNQNNS